MKKFTLILAIALVATVASKAQMDALIGLYTFSDVDNLFTNTATVAGVGTVMCEGIFKFDPDATDTSADDMASTEVDDWAVIDGITTKAIALKAHNWFKVWHGIPANGGGGYVNDFTVVMDLRVADANGIGSLLEVNPTPTANGYTSELEFDSLRIGSVGAPASGEDALGFSTTLLEVDTWYRVAYSATLATGIQVYVDGVLFAEATGDFTDARPAPYGADTDPDDAAMKIGGNNESAPANDPPRDGDKDIDMIAIFNKGLSDTEVAALGAPGTWVGIRDRQVTEATFSFYPNPAKGMLNISGIDLVQLELVSLSGQVMKHVMLDGQNSVDVSDMNSGMYLIKAIDVNNNSAIQKLVIE